MIKVERELVFLMIGGLFCRTVNTMNCRIAAEREYKCIWIKKRANKKI